MQNAFNKFITNRIKDVLFYWYFPRVYKRACKQTSVKDVALFVDRKDLGDAKNLNFEAIKAQILSDEKSDFELKDYSLHYGTCGMIERFKRCKEAVFLAASAKFIFIDDASNLFSCLPLRSETKIIQLWHACGAFKKFGMSTADKLFGGDATSKKRHPFYENLSLVTVSSKEIIPIYEHAMDIPAGSGVVCDLGVARTDVFFDEEAIESAKKAVMREIFGDEKGARDKRNEQKKILLYAPTFRGDLTHAKHPQALNLNAFKESLEVSSKNDFVLLIKKHPAVNEPVAIPEECKDFAFDVSDEFDVNTLMMASDALITDYSSVVFEYSLLPRPMFFFAFDKNDYDDWRGFYFDYDEMTPGPVVKTTAELAEEIAKMKMVPGINSAHIENFRKKFMAACDGKSALRIWKWCVSSL